jgi:predicted permease
VIVRRILRDLRFAVRTLSNTPAFTATAILSLALGIGANTAIFGVVRTVLLRPLPYRDPNRLVILWNTSPGLNITQDWFSTAQYFDIKTRHSGFEDVAAAIGANYNLAGDDREPERIGCIRVSSNLLPMLGAPLAAGRLFEPDEDLPGQPSTAILSYATWTRRYGRDPSMLGRTIRLNDQPFQIVGVLGPRFSLPREVLPTLGVADDGDVFLPLPLPAAARTDRGHEDYNVLGNLRPGVTLGAARAEMDGLTAGLRRDYPDVYPPNGGLTFTVVPLLDQVVGDTRRPLWILFGAVGFVLLIACANVANVMLSRALGRRNEFAVRAALGASRRQLAAQVLTESVALSIPGAVLGIAIAAAAIQILHAVQPASVPRLRDLSIDVTTLAFTAIITFLTALLFGLAPALGAGRVQVSQSLRDTGRAFSGSSAFNTRRPGLRTALVVAQLSLSVMLLIGAGLLIRSFVGLQQVPPGFDRRGVLTFELMMAGRRYASAENVRQAYRTLWQEIDGLPGVSASGGVTSLPLSGFFAWGPITIEGRVPPPGEKFINADQRTVSGRYFETMGIPLIRGRLFTADDTPDKPRVAIIDQRMADEFWPGQDPIGKRIRNGDARSTAPWITIVGVVGRVKQYGLDTDSRIAFYTPQSQGSGRSLFVVVKTAGEPTALAADVTRAVQRVDPSLPLYRVRTMEALVERSLSQQRFTTGLLSAFAGAALVLALIGIYGLMSYMVAQSARELGIRMALGATPRAILGRVLTHATVMTCAGGGVGLIGAAILARLLRGLTFGVAPTDPIAFGSVALLLAVTGLTAAYFPARRATRIDPIGVLR